jgi:NAD(P)-dependent dehydrogenase (short-subunit alcohol dehydrogenase family)
MMPGADISWPADRLRTLNSQYSIVNSQEGMMNSKPLQGKTLLLTGASRNLGAETARQFAGLGARIALNHFEDGEMAEALMQELHDSQTEAIVVEADIAKMHEVERLVQETTRAFGPVDILIHCAGPFSMTPFVEMKESEWESIFNANTKAAYMLARHVAPEMLKNQWGRIILISAGSAFIRTHSIYTLSKAGIITLTELLASELGPYITVNAIAPGQIEESAAIMDSIEPGFSERALEAAPLKRLCLRSQVAEMMGLICTSPAMEIITGHTFVMDGGWRLRA